MNSQQPPEGTRYSLPAAAARRAAVLARLAALYDSWGYRQVEVPALEVYDPAHPRARQAFKFGDRDGGLLALRTDFTPALSGLVRQHWRDAAAGAAAVRLQYAGSAWQAIDPDLVQTREFTQVGIELIGVSNARADTELIHLARESVRAVGLAPRVEIGNPALVRCLLELAGVAEARHDAFADALDRKDQRTLHTLLDSLDLAADMRDAFLLVSDLYGGRAVLEQARRELPWPEAQRELDRVEEILAQFEDESELILDLGSARRLSYYTGVTFRAYTFDFGLPLLGGGRYDGALLPYAAGFSLGLERLLSAANGGEAGSDDPIVLSSDDIAARVLRRNGFRVIRSLAGDPRHLRAEALSQRAAYTVHEGGVEAVGDDASLLESLRGLLEAAA